MDQDQGPSAYDLIHTLSRDELAKIIRNYGEERMAGRIARAIVERRILSPSERRPISPELWPGHCLRPGDPPGSTRPPGPSRLSGIAVNDELASLRQALADGMERLKDGGRFCVISFHSLEDRIVKNAFHAEEKGCICPSDFPLCACGRKPTMKVLTRKPVVPGEAEVHDNPRARSAKLRVAEEDRIMQAVEVLKQTVRPQEDASGRIGYSTWIFIASVLMAVALLYVWSHIHMTELEYQIARELSSREQITEEQAKLKVELATLKSPQRIETIARERLQMTYPEREQVIMLK